MKTLTTVLLVINLSWFSFMFEQAQRWAFERIYGKPKVETIRVIDGRTGEPVIIEQVR
jgi:hypothetical protein